MNFNENRFEEASATYKSNLISESASNFDLKYSEKYPELLELFSSDDQKDQMRAALTVKMMDQTQEYLDDIGDLNEAVTQNSLGRLNRKVLDVVRIFYPQIIAHELVDIQTLPGQTGDIFTVMPRYGNTQGLNFVDGDGNPVTTPEIFKHFVPQNSNQNYSVQGEGTGGGSSYQDVTTTNPARHSLSYANLTAAASYGVNPGATGGTSRRPTGGDTNYLPIRPGSYTLTVTGGTGAGTYSDNGSGALTSSVSGYTYGFVNYETGELRLTWGSARTASTSVEAVYNTVGFREMDSDMANMAVNANTLPRRVELNIIHKNVKAQMYPLQVDYTVSASLAAKAHLGVNINDVVVELASHYIKWERDNLLTYAIRQNVYFPTNAQVLAGYGTGGIPEGSVGFHAGDFLPNTRTVAPNVREIPRRKRFGDFEITIDEAEATIQRRMGRGRVDWVLCGNNVANVIRRTASFRPQAVSAPIGTHVIGTLRDGTITVIKDIHMNKNNFVCGYRGYMAGDAAIILAEWVPLYFTPMYQSATFTTSHGMMSAYDLVLNNEQYLVGGTISNYSS